MRPQIIIGLYREGATDICFLESIIKRTFEDICFECQGEIEILDIQDIIIPKSSFVEDVVNASEKGVKEFGITILCIHADADSVDDSQVVECKITPALLEIEKDMNDFCKVIVPVLPVQMTEAWMLADKDLLRKEIGTRKSEHDLDIYKRPEEYADPKQTIENAIRIARQELTKRRRQNLTIAELYLPIGRSVALEKLKNLPSYRKFYETARKALIQLNYLY